MVKKYPTRFQIRDEISRAGRAVVLTTATAAIENSSGAIVADRKSGR
jgi:hypothetical protein